MLFFKSLEKQSFQDFELVIADGGSKNIKDLKKMQLPFPFKVVSVIIGEKFERAKLNNVAVRNSTGDYAMTTDVDMFFGPNFFETVINRLEERPNAFIESRTLYWKPVVAKRVYKGELNPFEDLEACKLGRIKKRTTAGGCQCQSKENWEKIKGFDEAMVQWGSEDSDLLIRVSHLFPVIWLGESREEIQLFHQPHAKTQSQVKEDLHHQEKNKKILNLSKKDPSRKVNLDGWGGIYDA
tara:strand:- start:7814 stop:8530 length:717 start_codon:yes stop_codon:yes gene_type:complete